MIHTWQITPQTAVPLEFPHQASLDEITRQLPEGYYSTFRTYAHRTRVIGLKAHLERLYQPVGSPDVHESILRERLRRMLLEYSDEVRVRLVMTYEGQLYASIEPLKPLPGEVYENGVHAETVEMARLTPHLKSTRFISRSQGEREHIAQEGIFEALLVKDGKILEGMTSNFFYILAGMDEPSQPVLCTAEHDILLGVTRQTVIEVARGRGLEIEYQPLRRDQLEVPREAFITSSSRGIVPVIQIDEVTVGQGRPGPVTKELSEGYEMYVLKNAEEI